MAEKKVYGLIIPKKGQSKEKPATPSSFNVFGDDSDEDETTGAPKSSKPVGPFGQTTGFGKMKRQTQMDIDKALQEDSNIYEYDAIYDKIQEAKPKVGPSESENSKKDHKPKYIANLLKAAEKRKKEDERRKERQVQKEREAEGEKFKDKEAFVTSAYKQKMLEMQEEEERERREAALEAMMDVTKQKDMSGFYRYLYRTTAGDGESSNAGDRKEGEEQKGDKSKEREKTQGEKNAHDEVKKEPSSPETAKKSKDSSSSSSSSDSCSEDSSDSEADIVAPKTEFHKKTIHAQGNLRKRRADSSIGEEQPPSEPKSSEPSRDHNSSVQPSRKRRSRSRSRSPKQNIFKGDRKNIHNPSKKRRSFSRSPERVLKGHRNASPSSENSRHSRTVRSRSRERHRRKERSNSNSRNAAQDQNVRVHDQGGVRGERERNSRREDEGRKEITRNSDAENDPVSNGLKSLRTEVADRKQEKSKVDPAEKTYPHHNSAADIKEARKRYLLRKIARENART